MVALGVSRAHQNLREKVAIKGCDWGWLAQVYAGHRGGREKVAIKVMQVPGDHRERVLKEFSQESLLLSICYTDFVLGFRGAPCCGTPLAVMQCSQTARDPAGAARGVLPTCSTSTVFADRGVERFCCRGLGLASPGPCFTVVQAQALALLLRCFEARIRHVSIQTLVFSLPASSENSVAEQVEMWKSLCCICEVPCTSTLFSISSSNAHHNEACSQAGAHDACRHVLPGRPGRAVAAH